MLILGLLLIVAGAGLVLAGVFTAELTSSGKLELLGIEMGATTLFLLGVAAAVAILWGLWITKFGARRGLRQRKEKRKLEELSDKLDRTGTGRRRDLDDDDPDRQRFA